MGLTSAFNQKSWKKPLKWWKTRFSAWSVSSYKIRITLHSHNSLMCVYIFCCEIFISFTWKTKNFVCVVIRKIFTEKKNYSLIQGHQSIQTDIFVLFQTILRWWKCQKNYNLWMSNSNKREKKVYFSLKFFFSVNH